MTRVLPPFVAGHDLISLVYSFMNACLEAYGTDYFLCRDMRITHLVTPGGEQDKEPRAGGASDGSSSSGASAAGGAGTSAAAAGGSAASAGSGADGAYYIRAEW